LSPLSARKIGQQPSQCPSTTRKFHQVGDIGHSITRNVQSIATLPTTCQSHASLPRCSHSLICCPILQVIGTNIA
jgi:hypothetical protein